MDREGLCGEAPVASEMLPRTTFSHAARWVSLVGACFLAACAAAAAGVVAAPRVVVGDRSVGGVHMGATAAAAISRLGSPTRVTHRGAQECRIAWRRVGLVATFLDLSSGDPCRSGLLTIAVAATGWRTNRGLRVGDPVARVRRLYPRARLHRSDPDRTMVGYWLVTRHRCAEVGGGAYPSLLGSIAGGRITALRLTASPCE